jgi:hypothetical protein
MMTLLRFISALIVVFHSVAYAQPVEPASCQPPELRTDIRPGDGGPPTEVKVGIRMVDLTQISDVDQTLTANMALSLVWKDPRLADLKDCRIALEKIWSPKIKFLNSGRMFADMPEVANIGVDGEVHYLQRYNTTLATYHNLQDFPFDNQVFRLTVWPIENTEDEVVLKVDEIFTGYRKQLNISDWIVKSVAGEINREYGEISNKYYSRYDFLISAERIIEYYIWKVIVPLALIVAMSWAVFWISPAQFGPQIGLSATSMLTLIAFIFATTNLLPKLAYLTILDEYILTSTLLVFIALVQSLTTTYLFSQGSEKVGIALDRICRWIFPIVFAVASYLIFSK